MGDLVEEWNNGKMRKVTGYKFNLIKCVGDRE